MLTQLKRETSNKVEDVDLEDVSIKDIDLRGELSDYLSCDLHFRDIFVEDG